MRIVIFSHSLVSDWNHGNAHFLRGIATELLARGHDLQVYEPHDGWSRRNLERDHGPEALRRFADAYPMLSSTCHDLARLDIGPALAGADLVLVHEWNEPELIARVGAHHRDAPSSVLLFHDTHHRSITDAAGLAAIDLRGYDGVLAFGASIARMYLERGWARRAWTWHEAADVRVFYPHEAPCDGDVVWIGNFGDGERTREIDEFLLTPVQRLGLRAAVYGVRYPDEVLARLAQKGVEYRGWIPNYDVPQVFAQFRVTVHIPRGPYVASLPDIPTIRPFEALACGIPLVSARWRDAGGLFTPGEDFLVADDGEEMTAHLQALMERPELRARLAARGRQCIEARHTCAHRVDELLHIYDEVRRSPVGSAIATSGLVRLS